MAQVSLHHPAPYTRPGPSGRAAGSSSISNPGLPGASPGPLVPTLQQEHRGHQRGYHRAQSQGARHRSTCGSAASPPGRDPPRSPARAYPPRPLPGDGVLAAPPHRGPELSACGGGGGAALRLTPTPGLFLHNPPCVLSLTTRCQSLQVSAKRHPLVPQSVISILYWKASSHPMLKNAPLLS